MTDYEICLRDGHIWMVPDLALMAGQERNVFPGKCSHCGNTRKQSGSYWRMLREVLRIDVRGESK